MILKIVLYSAVALIVYGCAVTIANRSSQSSRGEAPVTRSTKRPLAGFELSLVTWNLGYGGLGEESDFVADGGTHTLPLRRSDVGKNIDGIRRELGRIDADVFLLQEIAVSSWLNYWHDVRGALAQRFQGYDETYEADIATKLLPPPLRIEHGTAIYSRRHMASAAIEPLPLEDIHYGGLLRKFYRMHIARLPLAAGSVEWVIINVHLAAFDEGARVRRQQLHEAIVFAQREYAKGNHVLIGGDFNMEVARDHFPHRTEMKDRFWLHDFPTDEVPAGWGLAFDLRTPTVRTVHKAYVLGESYTTVIDGFIHSPNVEVVSERGIDLGFKYSDHQPVLLQVRVK